MTTGQRPIDLLVRVEWAAVALLSFWIYPLTGQSWVLLVVLLLAPDVSMLAYLAGPRAGAYVHNVFHVLFWPTFLIGIGIWMTDGLIVALGLIWLIHIAIDRSLGWGLKLPTGFQDTHLGRMGDDVNR